LTLPPPSSSFSYALDSYGGLAGRQAIPEVCGAGSDTQGGAACAIEAVGKQAMGRGAAHVLVAGDVYDSEAPLGRSLMEPLGEVC
jgi:hypothetical protein